MSNCFVYCSICPIKVCDDRTKKANIYIPTCNGECSKCDGAINDKNLIFANQIRGLSLNGICRMYNLQKEQDVRFNKLVGEIDGDSIIEKIILRIRNCQFCKYDKICRTISKNITINSIQIEEYLDIKWNFNNKAIINAIPNNKLQAFFICESLKKEFANLLINCK